MGGAWIGAKRVGRRGRRGCRVGRRGRVRLGLGLVLGLEPGLVGPRRRDGSACPTRNRTLNRQRRRRRFQDQRWRTGARTRIMIIGIIARTSGRRFWWRIRRGGRRVCGRRWGYSWRLWRR